MRVFLIFMFCTLIHPAFSQNKGYVMEQVIIMIQPDQDISLFIRNFNTLHNPDIHLYPVQALSERHNLWLMKFTSSGLSDDNVLWTIKAHNQVIEAQYNHYVELRSTGITTTNAIGKMNSEGISLSKAWDISTGGLTSTGDTIVVGIIDFGVDINHKSLRDNIWRNPAENNNNRDSDGNGFIDDIHGWNFEQNSPVIFPEDHGTSVAGIIGGKDNSGIFGINSDLKMMPVLIGNTEATVFMAYLYILDFRKKYNRTAGKEGAFIVATNTSAGVKNLHYSGSPIWCLVLDLLGNEGILNIIPTLNENKDMDKFKDVPSRCNSDFIISVTATDQNDHLMANAARGRESIHLAAPGDKIPAPGAGDYHALFSGTATAASFVTGAVALMYAASCTSLMSKVVRNPENTAREVKKFILDGVDPHFSLMNTTISGGRLNIYNSLILAESFGSCELGYIEKGSSAGADQFGILGLYPNPAREYITITYNNLITGNNQFVITNVMGQKLLQFEDHIKGKGLKTYQIDISELSTGIYFLYIATGYKQSNMHKFIIH